MDWKDSITEYQKFDCKRGIFQEQSPECKAWEIVYAEKVEEGNQKLGELSFEELRNSEQQYCSRDKITQPSCKMWEEVRNQKGEQFIIALSITDVEKTNSQFCDKDQYGSLCGVWKKIWNEKSEQLIKFLVDNDDEFKKTYNSCYEERRKAKSSSNNLDEQTQNINNVITKTPCLQAAEAYKQRNLGWVTFDKAID